MWCQQSPQPGPAESWHRVPRPGARGQFSLLQTCRDLILKENSQRVNGALGSELHGQEVVG